MNSWLYRAYTLAGSGLVLSGFPLFFLYTCLSGRHGRHLGERLGNLSPHVKQQMKGVPRIWLHAVSLGEVSAAGAIISALRHDLPGCSILLSTTTEHGKKLAKEILGEKVPVVYGPIDFIGSVRKALLRIRPHILGFLETEIWPAWLMEAHHLGIRTAIVNGRLSKRSIGGYLRWRPFFKEVLAHVDAFSMISRSDASRIIALGAVSKRVTVNGNAKYDVLQAMVDEKAPEEIRNILKAHSTQAVFVAGSTRTGEEDMLLDAFEAMRTDIPDLVFVLAPRHLSRLGKIVSLLQSRKIGYHLWDDLVGGRVRRKESVVLVNTFGVLARIYSAGSFVFCGGSLVPKGGQNPLEAAVWGKAVFYGPSMEDFQEAVTLLENAGAGIQVANGHQLAQKILWFYRHPTRYASLCRKAKETILSNGGAAKRHAEVIRHLAMP
jgi:3-deoxy-D-manno-octulosonic-acid transferase